MLYCFFSKGLSEGLVGQRTWAGRSQLLIIIDCYLLKLRDNADQNHSPGTRSGENIKKGEFRY